MTLTTRTLLTLALLTAASYAQTSQPKPPTQQAARQTNPQTAPQAAPLRLQSLDPTTQADPFPPVDPRNFTADTPTPTAVDRYLHAVIGYDSNRIWRVESITKTKSPGVTRVSALISERTPNAKVLNATFYVMPDGKHLIAEGTGVTAFGDNPYAENAALLRERTDGPAHGAAAKDFLLVEFADLQCPHCKDAQATMARLATDFPSARIVYQSFPIAQIHPYAFRAAADGACIALAGDAAFFTFAQAVYDTQGALTPESGDQTLAAAITKAGADPAKITACATTPAIKAKIDASTALGADIGVNQTPMLAVNGRLLPLTSIPYETLRQIVAFQATLDGIHTSTPANLDLH